MRNINSRCRWRFFLATISGLVTVLSFGPLQAVLGSSQLQLESVKWDQLVPRLSTVSPYLVRGGQPTADGLRALKAMGLKSVINLRTEGDKSRQEAELAQQLGLKYFHIPLTGLRNPTEKEINSFLDIVKDPANQPAFVHCMHGRDRTGAMVGIYRINVEGWDARKAYEEMREKGFRPFLVALSDAVFDYSDALGRPAKRPLALRIQQAIEQRTQVRLEDLAG